eukprot:Gb_27536 [translate_table: standard]
MEWMVLIIIIENNHIRDIDRRFLDVFYGFPRSVHDSRIL